MFDVLGRKKGLTLKLYPLIECYIKNIFMENHAENVHQKLVPDPFLILVNNPKQPLHAKSSLKNEIF